MSTIGVIIPAYEPDKRLLDLLVDLDRNNIGPVYIINDGSGAHYKEIFDRSAKIVKRLQGELLTHEVNKGKGRALKTAFQYILENNQQLTAVVTADSDGQHTVECIKKVIQMTQEQNDCLVLGVRNFNIQGIPWKSRFGNTITEKIFKYLAGVHITDTQTGLRGIPRDYMIKLIDLKGERFEFEMRMLLDAADNYKIIEIPVETIYDSKDHHQTHFNPFKDSIKIYRILGEKFLKYIFSSTSSSLLDLILFGLVCIPLKTIYPLFYVTIATIVARIFSSIYNYLLNYKFVFKSKESIKASSIKYFSLAIAQMICSACIVTVFVNLLHNDFELQVKIIVDTVLFFISYHIQQHFIFHMKNKVQ